MYKCPKCGNTESFYANGRIIFFGWVQFDGDGEIVDYEELSNRNIENFEILNVMRCDNCNYEDTEDEFED